MRDVLKRYYERLARYAEKTFGTAPTVPWSEELDGALLISEPDEDGEVAWTIADRTEPVDWRPLEKSLGFALAPELKEYYGSCFLLSLRGKFGNTLLDFYPMDGTRPVTELARLAYEDGQHVFPGSQIFLVGWAMVGEDDGYFIFFDNGSGKLFCHDPETGKQVLLSYSIAGTIDAMEARM